MDRFDRDILQTVLAWIPYAGPDDDLAFPNFGMSAMELKARFREILEAFDRARFDQCTKPDRLLVMSGLKHLRRAGDSSRDRRDERGHP
jgi:hypothetical protein